MFDVKQPCKDCPFIEGGNMQRSLAEGRLDGIKSDLMADKTFSCHKTVDYEHGDRRKEKHCAGAMIYLYKNKRPNQAMRIGERLGMLKESELKGWDLVEG